jgi:hypothetical protein
MTPIQFLLRDGFDDMNFEDGHFETIKNDRFSMKYLNANKQGRENLYSKLLDTLKANSLTIESESESDDSIDEDQKVDDNKVVKKSRR